MGKLNLKKSINIRERQLIANVRFFDDKCQTITLTLNPYNKGKCQTIKATAKLIKFQLGGF